MPRLVLILNGLALIGVAGCVTRQQVVSGPGQAGKTTSFAVVAPPSPTQVAALAEPAKDRIASEVRIAERPSHQAHEVQPARYGQSPSVEASVVTADFGLEQLRKTNDGLAAGTVVEVTQPLLNWRENQAQFEQPASVNANQDSTPFELTQTPTIDLNLPSVLAMIDGQHPVVGFARWRVQEAYAQLAQAEVLWLPSIRAGLGFHRHDGNYQASNGDIVDVNRNSFQYGFGVGATGAGTTPRPGFAAQFHLADALFLPEIAEKTAWARGHAATAVLNEQLLRAAIAYIELVAAHQEVRILEETKERTAELSKITVDFASAGEGLQSDADRVETELILLESRVLQARERAAIASARLAQTISLGNDAQIAPLDVNAVPLELVYLDADKNGLVATALSTRPELKESQALVAAACDAYQREKYAPFVPSVLLGYSTSGFGGGLGGDIENVDGRYDLDALLSWEMRNFGLGERASRRESAARIQQAKYDKLRVMDRVAYEVAEAYSQVQFRSQQMTVLKRAIESAQKSLDANLARIRDGEGLPIEVLQAVQALEAARQAYLDAVIAHNQAQFQLQWSLGWPVMAP